MLRQLSVESGEYEFQPSHQPVQDGSLMSAQQQLHQLARQKQVKLQHGLAGQQLVLNVHQPNISQLQSPPPTATIGSLVMPTSFQSAISDMSQFTLHNSNHPVTSSGQALQLTSTQFSPAPQLTANSSTDNPELTVTLLLNGLPGIDQSLYQAQKTNSEMASSVSASSNSDFNIDSMAAVNPQVLQDFQKKRFNANLSSISTSTVMTSHLVGDNNLGNNVVKVAHLQQNPLEFKTEAVDDVDNRRGTSSQAAITQRFSFPQSSRQPQSDLNFDFENATMHHTTSADIENMETDDTIQNRHKELKRRLSIGSESDVNNSQSSGGKTVPNTHMKSNPSNVASHSIQAGEPSRFRVRSFSGDDYNLLRNESYTFMRPRSRTETWRNQSRSEDLYDRPLSHSDGAGLFRNPNLLTSPIKMKRKHRPAPLFIPPYSTGFHSRLRSPRTSFGESRGHTPPPYTPPPMLSPIRSGSGLFWSLSGIKPITPKSAPITPRSLLSTSKGCK